jgi:hypothetical protein
MENWHWLLLFHNRLKDQSLCPYLDSQRYCVLGADLDVFCDDRWGEDGVVGGSGHGGLVASRLSTGVKTGVRVMVGSMRSDEFRELVGQNIKCEFW